MQYEIRRNLSKNGGGRPGLLAFCESLKPQCFDARRFAGVLAFGVAALILYTFPVLVLILSLAASGGLGIMLLPSMGRFNHAGLLLAVGAAALILYTFPVLVLILSLVASGGLGIMLLPSMGRFNHAGLLLAVGVAALILYTFPVLVLILSLAASGGLGIMLLPSMGRFNHAGLLLAVGAAALFATTFFIGARGSRNVPARTMAFWVTVVGLGITAPRPRRFTPRRMILQPGKAA